MCSSGDVVATSVAAFGQPVAPLAVAATATISIITTSSTSTVAHATCCATTTAAVGAAWTGSTADHRHVRGTSLPPHFCRTLEAVLFRVACVRSDLSFDVDDVGAICIAHALTDLGEADLLAVVTDTGYPAAIGAASVLSEWYGHSSHVRLGAYKGEPGRDAFGTDHAGLWIKGGNGATARGAYVPRLVDHWPSPVKSASDVPDALDVYRDVLARAHDHSVAIAVVGFATNMARLLASGPDRHSSLSGQALVAKKVKTVVWQGGTRPHHVLCFILRIATGLLAFNRLFFSRALCARLMLAATALYARALQVGMPRYIRTGARHSTGTVVAAAVTIQAVANARAEQDSASRTCLRKWNRFTPTSATRFTMAAPYAGAQVPTTLVVRLT